MRKVSLMLITIFFLNMTACGYFLYPERVGQKGGKLDPAIVVLDAAALLFGILPGVVAFAVDISTGAIYLSPNQKSVIEKHGKTFARIDEKKLRPADQNEITIDRIKIAKNLSLLLGRPVPAEKIRYYTSNDRKSPVFCEALFAGQ